MRPETKQVRYSKRIDDAVGRALVDNPINVMDILRVYTFARELELDGITDDVMDATLAEYVRTIRVDINPMR
jgi:hypothetical protein